MPVARRIVSFLRDAWLVAGISLALVVLLEVAYRAQGGLRRALASDAAPAARAPDHPYASEAWWAEWLDGAGAWRNRYDPYRGTWPEPRSGPYLNIDSLGRRVTVQAPLDPADVRFTVYLFGGSTMFGYTARDEWTIPSQLAAVMEEGGTRGVEVVNFAQSGFNIAQNLSTLFLELRAGRVPDAVVFLDGNNEIAPAFQNGRAGGVLNEDLRAARLRSGPRQLADRLLSTFTFVRRVGGLFGLSAPGAEPRTATDFCPAVADAYLGTVSIVEGLGSSFGFAALFFWQPMLATTGKELTSFERSMRASREWGSAVVECSRIVDEAAIRKQGRAYASLATLFDERTETVFLDDYGHVTEAGNRRVAEAIHERLAPVLPASPP